MFYLINTNYIQILAILFIFIPQSNSSASDRATDELTTVVQTQLNTNYSDIYAKNSSLASILQNSAIVEYLKSKNNISNKNKTVKNPAPYSDVNLENLQNYFQAIQNDKEKDAQNLNGNSNLNSSGEIILAANSNLQQPPQQQLGQTGAGSSVAISHGQNFQNTEKKRRTTSTATSRRPSRPSMRSTTTKRPKPRPTAGFSTKLTTSMTTKEVETSTESSSDDINSDDATWILICGFIIFTMQTGFGMLEGGIVSQKNETNIMMKNVADVVLGGFTYWLFGYGITYGTWYGSSPVFGLGYFAVDAYDRFDMGTLFTSFFFQLSFATTATTIVSGAVAERCNFKAYCLYSFLATFTYSVQARWVWGPTGFLGDMGAVDIAGSGCVHLVGGSAAFIAAWMLGPRLGRYDKTGDKTPAAPPLGNPTNALVGLFFLWWGWFAFNAGSTYGVSGEKWKYAARAASTTVIASIGGGLVGLFWGFLKPGGGKIFDPIDIINTVLGALVGVTAGCALFHSCEAFFTGVIGAIVVILAGYLPDLLKIDDPVGATSVHGFGGIWGLLAVGVFAEDDEGILGVTKGRSGLVRGGGWELLAIQTLTAVCIIAWAMFTTVIILFIINLITPLRVSPHEELLGLDFCEHGIRRNKIGTSPALSLFGSNPEIHEIRQNIPGITGQDNPAHEKITGTLRDVRFQKPRRRPSSYDLQKSADLKKRKLKSATLFARAFYKLQLKGNRITPRERQYIFDEYSSPLRSSSSDESVKSGQRRAKGGKHSKFKNPFQKKTQPVILLAANEKEANFKTRNHEINQKFI